MPVYAYRCTECDTPLEVQQSFSDPSLTECPTCSGRLRKVFSTVGIVFKGSGFYRNDSRSAKAGGNGSGTSGDGSGPGSSTGGSSTGGSSTGGSSGDGASSSSGSSSTGAATSGSGTSSAKTSGSSSGSAA